MNTILTVLTLVLLLNTSLVSAGEVNYGVYYPVVEDRYIKVEEEFRFNNSIACLSEVEVDTWLTGVDFKNSCFFPTGKESAYVVGVNEEKGYYKVLILETGNEYWVTPL